MLRLTAVLSLLSFSLAQLQPDPSILAVETKVLSPPYFNIATGKKITATATCGTEGAERFCKLTGGTNYEFSTSLHQGQVCDVCDAGHDEKAHPVWQAIDGTEKWWQSPPLSRGSEYNKVNLTIDLGQVFHVAYVLIKFANSPRAGTWVLERSSDGGATFKPWQYFANTNSDCYNLFGMDSLEEITRDDSVICTSDYSAVVPLENGEVIVPMIKGRPGANNFSYATVLQEWSKATNVRLRFIRTKTLLGHLMAVSEEDPTVTRRYYYSIKDISIGGRCVCNGHADRCSSDPLDQYKLKCECQHNTCGDSCEMCCPGFVQKAWRAAVPESTNECEECNCHGHSDECAYDEDIAVRRLSLDLSGEYEGGGVCQNCQDNTAGVNCEQCADGFWRPEHIDPRDKDGCRPCNCDSAYTLGSCERNTGRCYCKVQYAGDRCDRCAPGYYSFPECKPCDCHYNGTLNDVCLPIDDACPCKYNFAGKYCNECAAGFYNFPYCTACECTGEGAASDVCDPFTGACQCAEGFAGVNCRACDAGYFNYPLCQRCACSNVGTSPEVCDADTGACFCEDRYTGISCDACTAGFYGFPLCEECACTQPGSVDNFCDSQSGKCTCKPNYQGDGCSQCAAEYFGYPNCVACACDVRGTSRTGCDVATGNCLCRENVGGRACDRCQPDYFNFPHCEECSCYEKGIKTVVPGVCLAFTTGQCDCKDNVMGANCDECKPLHFDIEQGCVSCNCFTQGTLDGVGECDREDGQCYCKPYTCTQRCSQCRDGFFALEELNYLGCSSCQCDVGGAMSAFCDKNTGQCQCRKNLSGRRCNVPSDGFYYPNLYQQKYEIEEGETPEKSPVRFGYSHFEFPGYSMAGYAEFSVVQGAVLVELTVHSSGLYRLIFRYHNHENSTIVGNVVVSPGLVEEGVEQTYQVEFEHTSDRDSNMVTVNTPFVLNRGTWTVRIDAAPGLLLDYLVLMPSDYYEPKILEQAVTQACVPQLTASDEECVMFTHPNLERFSQLDLTSVVARERLDAPSTAHPDMVRMDGSAGETGSVISADVPLASGAGKYVLVLEYASNEQRFQEASVVVSDGAGAEEYTNVKFNIYSCPYSFICRQVALGVLDDVKVFDMSLSSMRVRVASGAGDSFHALRLTAIPLSEWTMELVEPKPLCITTRGPAFEECDPSTYPIPARATVFEPEPATDRPDGDLTPPGFLNGSADPDDASTGRSTLQITKNLPPGRYVFLVHFRNPDHTSFSPRVVIDGGVTSSGTANVTFCPHVDGCRAVVTKADGSYEVDITMPTTTFTISVPDGKSMTVDYVLAVPISSYNPSLLEPEPVDKSGSFLRLCSDDDQQSFYATLENPSEFCRSSIYSLVVDYNDGTTACNCSGAGTIGGAEAQCSEYGGQCPCKPNVIGRQCERCMIGFYGYPNCQPCKCDGLLCDETGECICPPKTVEPDCTECQPLTHSYHVQYGCVDCDCNTDGVVNATNRACDPTNGQCRCREHVAGQRCDQCELGYYGFPNCQICTCDERGSTSEGCDPVTGQCLCKEYVEGLQCDRCKTGSFHLDGSNPDGCIQCFCFGASQQCHFSQYPATEISDMSSWRLLNLVEESPLISMSFGNTTLSVDVAANGGPKDPALANLYWAAPGIYLNDKVGSYGGQFRFTRHWAMPDVARGDAGSPELDNPVPIRATSTPTIILKGKSATIGHTLPTSTTGEVTITLSEQNFKHVKTGREVTRKEMMTVLVELTALHIRAADDVGVRVVELSDVFMETTDYALPVGSGPSIPGVEECVCPAGYTGHSCQQCDRGHYRYMDEGGYGSCRQCECFPHCDVCDPAGQLISGEHCLHNTAGENCQECEGGFIGNTTDGIVSNCQPCPCPYPTVDGNFAESCEESDGNLICHCQMGYTGERCELCANGYFGNPDVLGGFCQPCNCHGNLDANLIMETCDTLTGECADCMFNTGGKYCERCADGFFGDAIVARDCRECSCEACGTSVCDHQLGHCSCRDHVIGQLCDQCEPGFYDFASCDGCRSCACAEGAISGECDQVSGQCACAPNVVGLKCERCAPGFWDYGDDGCKPCNCRNNGPCNPVNGLCECPPGVTGEQCDECELRRHILHPGATACTRCGSCTDDLLDVIEPMTGTVEQSLEELSNISIGVFAYQRLRSMEQKAQDAESLMDDEDQFIAATSTSVDSLLSVGVAEMSREISGSGDDNLDGWPRDVTSESMTSAVPVDMTEQAVGMRAIQRRIDDIEDSVSSMCNRTDVLLKQVTTTSNATGEGWITSNDLATDSSTFADQARQLLDSLTDESSGDRDDYQQKVAEAEILLQAMRDRDFMPMLNISEEELAAAQDLLRRVEMNFTNEAAEVDAEVNDLSERLTTTHEKLRELRNKLNDATQKTNDATTANAVNRKNVTEMAELIAGINADAQQAQELLDQADEQLAAARALTNRTQDGIDNLDILAEAVREEMANLQPVHDALVADIDLYELQVQQAEEYAGELRADADRLNEIDTIESQPQTIASLYRQIVNAMGEASTAADDALAAATEAENNVADQDLQSASAAAQQRSSDLLSATQDLQANELATLDTSMRDTKQSLDDADARRRDLFSRLDAIEANINSLDRGDVAGKISEVEETADESNQLAETAKQKADELQDKINSAPDPNTDLPRELRSVEVALGGLPDDIDNMNEMNSRLRADAVRLNRLEKDYEMEDKYNKIRKKIAQTRSIANRVKSSMRFSSDDPTRVQLRTPITARDTEHGVSAEFFANVDEDSPDNSLLFLGDDQENGDHMRVDTEGGRVKYTFKVGTGVGVLYSDRSINDSQWHRIVVSREGNTGTLQVGYYIEGSVRGDEAAAGEIGIETQTGTTDAGDLVADMPSRQMKVLVGGGPDDQPGSFCMSDIKLKNETVGLWNFKSYEGPIPGNNCLEKRPSNIAASQSWRFAGVDSYIRIAREDTQLFTDQAARAHYVGFSFQTLQDNSLLFLVGETTEQFMAMQVVDGKLVMSWNFGFVGGPQNATVSGIEDVTKEPTLLIKAGFSPTHSSIAISINLRLSLRQEYERTATPNITSDIWVGGIWCKDIKPGFEDVLVNIRKNFRGCMSELNFNGRKYGILNAKENIGVTLGCKKEVVQDLSLTGSDFVEMRSGLQDASTGSGGFSFCTNTSTGTILSIDDRETDDKISVYLRNGHLVLSAGDFELMSARNLADGTCHITRFQANQNGSLVLAVDNELVMMSEPLERVRSKRQNERENPLSRATIYIGGAANSAMFNGCIKNLRLVGDRMHTGLVTEKMRCGVDGTVCVGRPVFNSCGAKTSVSTQPANLIAFRDERPANRPPEIVYMPYDGYDAQCTLSFLPEVTGYRYQGDGYSKYYIKKFDPKNWRYSLYFRTVEKRGLIFFMSDTRCNEHIAVYLVKGKVTYSVMFGSQRSRLKSTVSYSDGQWHHVTFERKGNSTQLMLDGSIEARGVVESDSETFYSHMPFYIGGLHAVPKRHAAGQINQKNLADYVGCIRDVTVNNMAVDNEGSGSGLRINVSPCFGATEPGTYFPHPEEGHPSAYMVAMESYNVEFNMQVTLEIRPRMRNGIIFAVGGSTGDFFNLVLVDGKLAARLHQGGETLLSRYDPSDHGGDMLCDGNWHRIKLIKAKNIIALTVDSNLVLPIEEGSTDHMNCTTDGPLYVGGIRDGFQVRGLLTRDQFVGCIRDMKVDLSPVNADTAVSVHGDVTINACPVN